MGAHALMLMFAVKQAMIKTVFKNAIYWLMTKYKIELYAF